MRLSVVRQTCLLAFVILAVFSLAACKSDQEKVADFMAQGSELVEEEQDKEAVIAYRNVLKIDPNHSAAHFALARAYLRLGRLKDGYWELRESVRLDPDNLEARERFAEISTLAKDFEEVDAQADVLLEADPESSKANLLKAAAMEGLRQPEDAEAYLVKAIELDPENHELILGLAKHYARRKMRAEAEAELIRYTEVDPGRPSFVQLGRFYSSIGELDKARKALRDAIENDEERAALPYAILAQLAISQNRTDDAIAIIEEGLENAKDTTNLLLELARIYARQGQPEKADLLIQEASEKNPDDPTGFLLLSSHRNSLGDLDGALEAVDRAAEVAPADRRVLLRRSELLAEKGFRSKEMALLTESRGLVMAMLDAKRSDADALIVLAKIEMAEGSPEAAVVSLRQAINSKPNSADAHFMLGSALALQGDTGGARIELARALELRPNHTEGRRLLARIHAELGEHEYAIEQGRLYLAANPDAVDTRILVAQSLVNLGKGNEAYEEILRIPEESRDPEALYALGQLQLGRGEWDEARETLLRVNELRPNQSEILRAMLRMDKVTGRMPESMARIDQALESDPTSAALMQLQGEAALLNNDPEAAEASLKRATELDPTNVDAFRRLAGYYQLAGDREGTLEALQEALNIRPDLPDVHHTVGVLYETAGNPTKAQEHYEKAIQFNPDMGHSKNNLAYLLADRSQSLDRALLLAQQAKELLPDSPSVADTMGWVLFKRGGSSLGPAVVYLEEAEERMDPNSPSMGFVRYHLALAYESTGEEEKAIDSLDRALRSLDERRVRARAEGMAEPKAAWEADVRTARERLQSPTG